MARAFQATASAAVGPQFPSKTNSSGGIETQGGYVTLMGYSLAETGGTNPVTIVITDGGASSGKKIAEDGVVASGHSGPRWLGPNGVQVPVGCYVTVGGTGTPSVILYIA